MGVYVEALDGKGLLIPRVWSFITKQDLANVSQENGDVMVDAHCSYLVWHAEKLRTKLK